jgi:hypothetical protein
MPLAKLVKTALGEILMLVLGAQILLGFELSGYLSRRLSNSEHAPDCQMLY